MPVNHDNCRKTDIYVYVGERSKVLVVGSRFLDCLTVFTHSSNNAELWEINSKFVAVGESAIENNLQQKSHFIHKAICQCALHLHFNFQQNPWLC